MKRIIIAAGIFLTIFGLLVAVILAVLPKSNTNDTQSSVTVTTQPDTSDKNYLAVNITPDNLYDYFDYYELKSCYKYSDGTIGAMQIAYGLKLKPEYTALNSSAHEDTLKLTFTATGVINKGSYEVNYDTLAYTGTTESTEYQEVCEELIFWPKGDRTSVWTFGNYSTMYIMYLTDFTVTAASGTVYLKYTDPTPEA